VKNREQIESYVCRLIADMTGLAHERVQPTMKRMEIPEWDSFAHLEIMIQIEKEYGIRFSTAEIAETLEIGEIVALLESKSP